MKTVTGKIVLPSNAPATNAAQVLIEVRDVSLADAPSVVIAEKRLSNVTLNPNGHIDFGIPLPVPEKNQAFSFRVHVDLDGSNRVTNGDLLTTINCPVPRAESGAPVEIPVTLI